MAEHSAIEWTDSTFNPWIGCTRVSLGCDHCYAETLSRARLGVAWGADQERRRTVASTWNNPRRWNRNAAAFQAEHGRRRRVFCASLADVFDNAAPPAWRVDLFQLIRETPALDWQLLTKRIGNVAAMAEAAGGLPSNVWLGATIVNRAELLRDAPKLRSPRIIGPVVRFWSCEPLLGDLGRIPADLFPDWIIVGGESGPSARTLHPDWVVSARDQAEAAGVPFLFKQWGDNLPVHVDTLSHVGYEFRRVGKKEAGRRLHGRTHDGFPTVELVA